MLAICGSRSARPCLAGTKIANWDAAIYCAGVVRDSLVVGEIKRSLRSDAGSIDLRPDTVSGATEDVRRSGNVRVKSVAAFLVLA